MENFLNGLGNFMSNLPTYIGLVAAVFMSLGALFAVIPGDQPEKTLYKVAEFLKKFSRKPKE